MPNDLAHVETQDAAPMLPVDPMVSLLEKVLLSPDLPLERVQAAMDMQERQLAKQAEQLFNQAFAAAMAEMPDVKRTGENKHLKRNYATLDDLIRTARPVLANHGLSLNWQGREDADRIIVKAVLRHAMGHSIEDERSGPRDKSGSMNALQGGGSTETYLKRYTGFAILGLSSGDEIDDDGRGASGGSITEEQFLELRDLTERAKVTDEMFCQANKVAAMPELPAAKFEGVKKTLLARIAKIEAEV